MDLLLKLSENRVAVKQKYSQLLHELDSKYLKWIRSLLDEQLHIQRVLRQSQENELKSIDLQIQSIGSIDISDDYNYNCKVNSNTQATHEATTHVPSIEIDSEQSNNNNYTQSNVDSIAMDSHNLQTTNHNGKCNDHDNKNSNIGECSNTIAIHDRDNNDNDNADYQQDEIESVSSSCDTDTNYINITINNINPRCDVHQNMYGNQKILRDDSPALITTAVGNGDAYDPQRLPLPPLESVDSVNVTDINIITTNDSENTISKNMIDESMNHDCHINNNHNNSINTCQKSIKNKNVERNINSNDICIEKQNHNKESDHDRTTLTTVCDNHPQTSRALSQEKENNTGAQRATRNVAIGDDIQTAHTSNCIDSSNTKTNTTTNTNRKISTRYTKNNYSGKCHSFKLPVLAARQSCMIKHKDSDYSDINRIDILAKLTTSVNSKQQSINNRKWTNKKKFAYYSRIKQNGVEKYQCSFTNCKRVFSSAGSTYNHYMGQHTTRFQCQTCKLCFGSAGGLQRHERIHTGEKPYKCKYCNKKFSRNEQQMHHEKIHTGKKPYQCKVCGKGFTNQSSCNKHQRQHQK